MWRKRDLIIATVIVALISASVGFYELGLNQGKDIGYQNGFSQGLNSALIQMGTEIDLKQNSTLITSPPPTYLPNNVTLVYSFYVDDLLGQNETVDMPIYGVDDSGNPLLLFNTGYVNNDTGVVPLTTNNGNTELEIIFTANPNNNATAVLQFTSPLWLEFN